MNSQKRHNAIRALRRRRRFLADRVAHYRHNGNPSHDKAELAGITYALQIIVAAEAEGVLLDLERVPVNVRG